MAEHDRLRRLQMRESGRERVDVLRGLRGQRVLQREQRRHDVARDRPQIQAQVVRRLVVARAARAQLPAERPEPLDEHALEKRVDVLVAAPPGSSAPAANSRRIASSAATIVAHSASVSSPARSSSRACACDDTRSYGVSR